MQVDILCSIFDEEYSAFFKYLGENVFQLAPAHK